MKKIISLLIIGTLLAVTVIGCGSKKEETTTEETTKIITQQEAEEIAKEDLSDYLDGANLVTHEIDDIETTDEGDCYHVKLNIIGMKEGIAIPTKNCHVCDVDKHSGQISNRDDQWDNNEPY